MKNVFSFFDHVKFLRVFAFLLCLIFAFGFVVRPMSVSANVATMYLVTYGGTAASVNPYVLIGILALVALGYGYSTLDEYITESQSMLSSSEKYANWVSLMANITPGMTVTIPSEVQDYLKQKCQKDNKKVPDNIPFMYFPQNFSSLDSIALEDVFPQEEDVDIGKIETAVKENTGLLNEIKTSLSNLAGSVEAGFEKLTAKIIEWGSAINYNTGQFLIQCKSWISDVNNNVVKFGRDTVDWLKNINSNMSHYYNKLETKLDSIFGGGGVTIPPNLTDAMDGANNAEDAVKGDVQQGQDQAIHYIGRGKDHIKSYGSAFLAVGSVFSAFGSVPVFSDLLEFSLALGIFALLVNLGNSVYRANNIKSSASKKGG